MVPPVANATPVFGLRLVIDAVRPRSRDNVADPRLSSWAHVGVGNLGLLSEQSLEIAGGASLARLDQLVPGKRQSRSDVWLRRVEEDAKGLRGCES